MAMIADEPIQAPGQATAGLQDDYILLDRSGSMGIRVGQWEEAVGSINAYVQGLRDQKVPTVVTLVVFDRHVSMSFDVLRRSVSPADWKPIGIEEAPPRGHTPLYDAIGLLVSMALGDSPSRAAITIMTDGMNNASSELNREQANALLDQCRARGWMVTFLGANFDNAGLAEGLGATPDMYTKLAAGKMRMGMHVNSTRRSTYGATGQSVGFTEEEKKHLSEE